MVLQWLHVLFAIGWFGGSLFVTFVITPVARQLPEPAGHEFFSTWAPAARRYFATVAGVTVVLGVVRGLVLGLTFPSAYAITFVLAVLFGIAQAVFGAVGTSRTVERVAALAGGPAFSAGLEEVTRLGWLELAGFAVLLTLMIAMRFGY